MTRIHLFASGESARAVLDWLAAECQISPQALASTISYASLASSGIESLQGVPAVLMNHAASVVTRDDIVIVAGPEFQQAVGDLLGMGIHNIYNGNEMIRRDSVGRRFVKAAARLYIGPATPTGEALVPNEASRFAVEPIAAHQVPRYKLFIVNSMPKAGTVWMAAMLEDILGVRAQEQITVSHVGDIEEDWNKENNHGAVTLVRDMRDVVVSWFHNACRTDRELGFAAPRYPSIGAFYHEYFIGTLFGTKRFYFGDLERWLNLVSANYIPLIKYEDMVANTDACLRKLMTFWKVDVTAAMLRKAVHDHSFGSMERTVSGRSGFVADMVNRGHLRRGRIGSWQCEMPDEMAKNINERFAGYQKRLGYV